jgi:hypothetical protein
LQSNIQKTMEHYINQLIEDIHTARTKLKAPSHEWDFVDFENEAEIEDMTFAEEYIYGEREPLSQITGITKEMFPPPEKLSEPQQDRLVQEIEALLLHHNFVPEFPTVLPPDKKYSSLRNIWDQEYVEVSFGTVHIEFCDCDSDNCPFPGHCTTCEEIEAQMKIDEKWQKENGTSDNTWPNEEDLGDLLPFS